jgi:lysophospholipase L1-like esterase
VGISARSILSYEINGRTLTGLAGEFERAVIMVGSNGLEAGAFAVSADVFAIVDRLKDINPLIEVVVLTIPPVARINEYDLNVEDIDVFNGILLESAGLQGYTAVDYADWLKDDEGYLHSDYAQPDGVHLRHSAYELMLDIVQSRLEWES